jgi:hypothetical protein
MADPFSLALTVAVNLASMALTASQSHEGPRLQDLSVTVADYGTPIPYLMGRRRIESPVMHAEPLREEKTKNKTKGGKYTEYKYYGTWANLICGNETTQVWRIWGDRHLIYDSLQPRVHLFGPGPRLKPGEDIRFYYGTEDQLPDERIAARIEHDEGDASLTPAYRGVSYVMFEDVPLEYFGNRLPQVSIEASTVGLGTGGLDEHDERWLGYTRIAFGEPDPPESSWPGAADGMVCTTGVNSGWFGIASNVPLSSEWDIGLGTCTPNSGPSFITTAHEFIVGYRETTAGIFKWAWRSQVWQRDPGTTQAIYQAAQAADGFITLGDICTRVAIMAGMPEEDFDFSALDQIIYGFSWTQGRAADILMALLEIHDSDIRPNGFILEGIKRGQPLTGPIITYDWMARRRGDDGSGDPIYKITAVSESELPRRIMAVYSEYESEQQPNTAVAQRNGSSVWTNREVPVDLTSYAETADVIQPLAERSLRRLWMDAVAAEMTLTPKHYGLIPGDVRNLGFENGVTIRGRLQQVTIKADRSLFCRWLRDGAVPVEETDWEDDDGSIIHNLPNSPGAIGSGRPPATIYDPVESAGFVLDLPLLSDADDRTAPFAYFAAGPNDRPADDSEPDWSGATFLHSDNGDPETYENPWEIVGSGSRATHGTCYSVLGPGLATVIDEATELVVEIVSGTLESVTLEELLADGTLNLAVAGDELIQFRDAIVQSAGQYILRGLLRGVRGTEHAMSTHQAGERFVLCNSMLGIHSMGAGEIGDTDYYKVVTNGFDPADVDPFTEDYTGASHKPYSLVHVTIEREGNDWVIDGLRRTRIGGASFNGQNVPLGETSELYRIKVLDDYGDTMVTKETTSLPYRYLEADQIADLGGVQNDLTISICQMSPALSLEGYPTTASSED